MKKSSWMLTAAALGGFAAQGLAQDVKPMPAPAAPAVASAPIVLSEGCGNGGCCTAGCLNGCDSCDNGCNRGGIIADVSFMVLKPYWANNPAILIGENDTGAVNIKDFGDAKQFVPRIALGAVGGGGLGARLSWWGFATSQTEFIANAGPAGNFGPLTMNSASPLGAFVDDINGGMAAQSHLRMNVWDLEAIAVGNSGSLEYLASVGVRYAHLSQDYTAVDFTAAGFGGGINELVTSGHNFNGAGPTASVQVRRGQTLYGTGTLRGSLLFGEAKQTVTYLDVFGGGDPENGVSSYDRVMPVVEAELGIGVKRDTRFGNAFFEVGLNAQAWFDAGNSSRSSPTQVISFFDAPGRSTATDDTLGLFGFYLKAGIGF